MCLKTGKLFKRCGVNASCVCQEESSFKVVVQCIMCWSTRKLFKSCGISASCACQQKSCLQVVVSMHYVFVHKKAV